MVSKTKNDEKITILPLYVWYPTGMGYHMKSESPQNAKKSDFLELGKPVNMYNILPV